MVILKKIGVLSVGKIYAILMAIVGFIVGLVYALMFSLFRAVGMQSSSLGPGMGLIAGLGFAMIIVLPIVYAVMGFVIGVIGAALYNLIAKWVGGIEIELQ